MAFFVIFKGFPVAKNRLRHDERAPLNHVYYKNFCFNVSDNF